MLLNFFSNLFHDFSNWGIGQILSIVLTLIIIVISMPFTYIGYSIRRVVEFRIKKYEGFAIKKYTIHAIISTLMLLAIEVVLFFVLSTSKFYSISFILSCMVILGLMGVKLTFSLEEMIDGWIDDIFSKD